MVYLLIFVPFWEPKSRYITYLCNRKCRVLVLSFAFKRRQKESPGSV